MMGGLAIKTTPDLREILMPAFCALSEASLIEYFRTRTSPVVRCAVNTEEAPPERISEVMNGEFTFNNERHALAHGFDWRLNPSTDIEWLILLHKFYYASGFADGFARTGDRSYVQRWVELTASWVEQDLPPGFIAADVTGRRVQNWVYAWQGFMTAPFTPIIPNGFVTTFLSSLHAQIEYLIHHLHKARNHRTLELLAIFLGALTFPEFAKAAQWRAFALAELAQNALADFRADGGHCEQSSHYHCIVLRNFLQLVRLCQDNQIDLPENMRCRLKRALHFAAHLHRPDGEIPSLSDADGGSYLSLLREGAALLNEPETAWITSNGRTGEAPRETARLFKDSGYAILRSAWDRGARPDQTYLIFDCGPLGNGNHGHFDLLNVEAYANGQPLIVDPGRFTYNENGAENWRIAFRSTRAHSTVEVDGLNQTRYEKHTKKFKIKGPAPDHLIHDFTASPFIDHIHAEARSHEYPARHQRRIFFVDQTYWVIVDQLSSVRRHAFRLRYQLAPAFQGRLKITSLDCGANLAAPGLTMAVTASANVVAEIEQGWVSRRYGEKTPAPRPCFSIDAQNATVCTVIFPSRHGAPKIFLNLDKTARPVWACGIEHCQDGAAFKDVILFNETTGDIPSRFAVRRQDENGRQIFQRDANMLFEPAIEGRAL